MAGFLIRWSVCFFLARVLFLSSSQITTHPVSSQLHSFSFCLLHWCISKIDLLWRESAPEHWGHMCVVAGAAASRLALLAAPCLYPVVCQAAKQGKRWDKWLFMICHLPSSQLSPGPIYYSCRLPLCRRKHAHARTHKNAKHSGVLLKQTNTHTVFFTNISFFPVKSNISQAQFAIMSFALSYTTEVGTLLAKL